MNTRTVAAHAWFPKGKGWEDGLREIDMIEVDTEFPPIDQTITRERRVIEGPEHIVNRAYVVLRLKDLITGLSVFDDETGREINPGWSLT